jgi:DNA polymerase-3 subunit alpha
MSDRIESSIPFVGLHAHSVAGSIFDALDYPPAHMEFAYSNGMNAMAFTDHGNMNFLPYAVLHARKMNESGKDFKPIFGCEAYFVPSIKEWRKEYDKTMEDKKEASKVAEDETSGTTIENEAETKKASNSILSRRRHLVLLAQNQTGLNNLFKLVSDSYREENYYRYPRVDYDMLREHSEGLIASSACLGGVYAGCFWENREKGSEAVLEAMREVTRKMVSIFGDRWYGELQWNNIPEQHLLNQYVIQIQQEFGIKLVSTADSHYPNPTAWKDRELYKRLGWLGSGRPEWANESELPANVDEIGYELYPKNGDQMWASYKKYSELCGVEYNDDLVLNSITETHNIAMNRIERFEPDTTVRLPDFVVPAGETADSALEKFSMEGLRKKNLHTNAEYVERLRYELSVIADRGFSKYFLTMNQIAAISNEHMLTGPGRGSAAGSLVAYALEITQVDPIKYDLLFSRFLRADATDYPDIDFDVADPMVIKDVLIDRWGDNTVVPISNWNTLQLKSLIKDISKLYNIPFPEVNKVTGRMMAEATPIAKQKLGMKAGVYTPTFEEVKEYSPTLQAFLTKYPDVANHIDALYGQVRSCSRHAGGVVVAEDLDKYMPLISSKNVRQTPWSEGQNVRHLEPLGFIKFDILGLSTLRMIEGAIRHILKRHHSVKNPTYADIRKYYDEKLHPDILNLNDKKVYKNVFQNGKWAGVFQFTENGVQKLCKQAKPENIIDLSAITSIYRPGPLSAGVDKDYIDAKEAPLLIDYPNAEYKNITQETYGFLIFQEQIALLAHKLGKNITLDEGNSLRKVLTKKGTGKTDKVLQSLYNRFIEGCVEKGMTSKSANDLWEKFKFFSGYGFNKSHAVCYSIISYQCAWLLTYYEAEWLAAFLDKEPETKKEKAISIAKSFGYGIESLNINTSGVYWEISDDSSSLIQPLTSIKGLGESAIDEIYKGRPFSNIEDFLFNENMRYSKLNKKTLDVLVRSGAMNTLVDSRFTGKKHFWSAIAVDRPRKPKNLEENIALYAPEGDFTAEEEIQFLTELTGEFPISKVVSSKTLEMLEEKMIPPISEFEPALQLTWCIPRKVIPKRTANGKEYFQVEVVDSNSAILTIRCWGISIDMGDRLEINKPYLLKPDYNDEWGFSTRGRIDKYWKCLAS